MPSAPAESFRFFDLPRELRDKVYRNLLCSFDPPPTSITLSEALELYRARHDNDTSILRANSTTYKEAFEVLVKTNRFVKITSPEGLPLRMPLRGLAVPVVSEKASVVTSFKGFALSLDLSWSQPLDVRSDPVDDELFDSCTLMILHRDLNQFCLALTDGDTHWPGFSDSLGLSITMAPVLDSSPKMRHAVSFEAFFSKKTQENLLAPFRTHLYGRKAVAITGHVDKAVAAALRDDMRRDQWSNPAAVLSLFSTAKEDGSRLFREGKKEEGSLRWQDAALDLDKVHESSSWVNLVRRGGESFVSQLAEIYFLMRLNIAHHFLCSVQGPQPVPFACLMAEDSLTCAVKSMKKGFWMDDYKYIPSIPQAAKLRYRLALCLRLEGKAKSANGALMHIEKALGLQPNDAAILRERQNILAWMQRI